MKYYWSLGNEFGDMPFNDVSGLGDGSGKYADHLRNIQLSSIPNKALLRTTLNQCLVFLTCMVFVEHLPSAYILAWLFLMVGINCFTFYTHRKYRIGIKNPIAGKNLLYSFSMGIFILGISWLVPLFIFVPMAAGYGLMEVIIIFGTLTTSAALLMRVTLLACLSFIASIIMGSIVFLAMHGHHAIAAVTCVYGFITLFAAYQNSLFFLKSKINESEAQEQNELVHLLLNEFNHNKADWLWQLDKNGHFINVSPRLAYMMGSTQNDIEGKKFSDLLLKHPQNIRKWPQSFRETMRKIDHKKSFSGDYLEIYRNGQTSWWEVSAAPKYDKYGAFIGYFGVGSDITSFKKSQDEIAWMAEYDSLTNLPNRAKLMRELAESLDKSKNSSRQSAFMMIDLDHFKSINDTLGHQVGDQLLMAFSGKLARAMPKNALCGRLGGDEFAIIISGHDVQKNVENIAQKIENITKSPILIGPHSLHIGTSIGSAIAPEDGENVETLSRNADLALYAAKDTGRGCHQRYYPQLLHKAERLRLMGNELLKAIERDELKLYCQPLVDVQSQEIVSYEILLRWFNPHFIDITPDEFIPIAEENKLIIPIGNWVLHQSCLLASLWPEHLGISVNISAYQLFEPDFIHIVEEALSASGIAPERLELEITENIFIKDGEYCFRTLEKLQKIGVKLSLDDFGTGYSSLGYLGKIKFDNIKIDRSFMQGAHEAKEESIAIIRAVVAMASSLNISTTAEGVETTKHVEIAKALGCARLQGYHFSKPICADLVTKKYSRDKIRDAQNHYNGPYFVEQNHLGHKKTG